MNAVIAFNSFRGTGDFCHSADNLCEQFVVLSILIWVQTVCKGYQQTTKVAASKESNKCPDLSYFPTIDN